MTQKAEKTPQLPQKNNAKALLSIKQLTVRYGKKVALDNANLIANDGETLAIVGPSGCGKSSLLNSINRMTDLISDCKVSGQIHFNGIDILADHCDLNQLRNNIGMVFQQPNPFPLSIEENIGFPLKDHGMKSSDDRQQHIEYVLRKTGLWDEVKDRLTQNALSLSGGQQQRLCIARALALKPKLLLLDEPCSALDPLSTELIEQLIIELKTDLSIIMVTHNLGQARRVADQVAVCWIDNGSGCVIESNTTSRIFDHSDNPITQAYLRSCR